MRLNRRKTVVQVNWPAVLLQRQVHAQELRRLDGRLKDQSKLSKPTDQINMNPYIPTGEQSTQRKPISQSKRESINQTYYSEYNNMSLFDAESFLGSSIEEPLIKRPLLPANQDLIGITGQEVKARKWVKKDDPNVWGVAVDITIEVDPNALTPAQKDAIKGYDGKLVFRDGIMVDMTPDGAIDVAVGKNSRLRQYREALNLNNPGQSFNFRQLAGQPIRFKLRHKIDPDFNGGEPQEAVGAVAKP